MSDDAPLFHQAYGAGLHDLPGPIVRTHAVMERLEHSGEAIIESGPSFVARLLCRILRFPPPSPSIPLHVTMTREQGGEHWRRQFGTHVMESRFRPGPTAGTVSEKLGPLTGISFLDTDTEGVTQLLVGMRCFGLPLPRFLWPKLDVREGTDGPRYTFSMSIRLPWNALLVRYRGWLKPGESPIP